MQCLRLTLSLSICNSLGSVIISFQDTSNSPLAKCIRKHESHITLIYASLFPALWFYIYTCIYVLISFPIFPKILGIIIKKNSGSFQMFLLCFDLISYQLPSFTDSLYTYEEVMLTLNSPGGCREDLTLTSLFEGFYIQFCV